MNVNRGRIINRQELLTILGKVTINLIVMSAVLMSSFTYRETDVIELPITDSIRLPINNPKEPFDIKVFADSIANCFNVPASLVFDIGMNESGWRNSNDSNFILGCGIKGENSIGDLQVLPTTYRILANRYDLPASPTRKTLIIAAVAYLAELHKEYDSWYKARYAYGRGRYKHPDNWTKLERKFMAKIDWNKYE